MMQRKGQLVRGLVLIAIVGTLLCGILAMAQIVPDITRRKENPYQDQWTLESRPHTNILIDMQAVDIQLRPHDGKEILVSFDGNYLTNAEVVTPPLTVTQEGDTLRIVEAEYVRGKINFGPWDFGTLQGALTVLLPQEAYGQVTIDSFSGNVSLEQLQADAVTVTTSSGRISTSSVEADTKLHLESFSGNHTLENLEARSCDISSSSGHITLSDGTFDVLTIDSFSGKQEVSRLKIKQRATLESSSGGILAHDMRAESLRCKTFSGNVTLGACETEQLSVETSSGKVQARLNETPDDIDIETFSGSVDLTLPADAEFTCTTDTFSGNVTIDFPAVLKETSSGNAHVVGDGKHAFTIETSSGNIKVQPQ